VRTSWTLEEVGRSGTLLSLGSTYKGRKSKEDDRDVNIPSWGLTTWNSSRVLCRHPGPVTTHWSPCCVLWIDKTRAKDKTYICLFEGAFLVPVWGGFVFYRIKETRDGHWSFPPPLFFKCALHSFTVLLGVFIRSKIQYLTGLEVTFTTYFPILIQNEQ
jgi:hypothetical protein